MATVLEECATVGKHSDMPFFCREKDSYAKDIKKEMFAIYGGKCLSLKAVHIWVEKFSQGRLKVADHGRPGAEVAQQSRKLVYCGFRRTARAMGQVYQCWWMVTHELHYFGLP
jgi:hypothetical protein